jgi:hypothetical protein
VVQLDTEWHGSSKAELDLLYSRASRRGVLVIDDYGHLQSVWQALDEFFSHEPALVLNKIGFAVRVAVNI